MTSIATETFTDGTATSLYVADPSTRGELRTLDGSTERQTTATRAAEAVRPRRPRLTVSVRRTVVQTDHARVYTSS